MSDSSSRQDDQAPEDQQVSSTTNGSSDEVVAEFDQTNGLAPGLEGDDDRPDDGPDEPGAPFLGTMLDDAAHGFENTDDDRDRD